MSTIKRRGVTRRTLLQSSVVAGLAGADAITGFPAVHAAGPVTLRYLGTAVNQSTDIANKVKQDLGITIEYLPVTTDVVTKRIITQPESFDMVDSEYFQLPSLVPSGNLVGMDAKRIKLADEITTVLSKGVIGGKKIGDQGTAPFKVFYLEGKHSKTFSKTPTEWLTLIPTTYNADSLGIRPDLIGRPIEH
jgi:putative spermidine/putrescine transport system substrate-binding protein